MAEVGAGVRLGQVHGAGPLAGHHLRQVDASSARRSRGLRARRWRPASAAGRGRTTRLAEFQISQAAMARPSAAGPGRHALRGTAARPSRRRRRPCRLPSSPAACARRRRPASSPRGRRTSSSGSSTSAPNLPASSMTAATVSTSTVDRAIRDQVLEPGCGLEREEDVVDGGLVGHGRFPAGLDRSVRGSAGDSGRSG